MGNNKNETKGVYANDILLVYKDNIPQFFARVEDISPDIKPDWFQIKLLILVIPVQEVIWILKDIYINGAEFYMGGNQMRLEKIIPPETKKKTEENIKEKTQGNNSQGKVINFSNHKKKNDK